MKIFPAPQHTRFILPLTSPDKIIAALRKRELAYGRQSRLITPPVKKNRAFPTGNALLYISLLYVVFGRVRPQGAPCFCFEKKLEK